MKNKFLVVALIAILLAVGMVLVSCDEDILDFPNANCPGDGKCEIDLESWGESPPIK